MNRTTWSLLLVMTASLSLNACKDKNPPTTNNKPEANKPAVDKKVDKKDEPTLPKVDPDKSEPIKEPAAKKGVVLPDGMETEANATDTIVVKDYKGKIPDDYEARDGKFVFAKSWTDKNGLQSVVVQKKSGKKKDMSRAMIVADFTMFEGSAWSSQRKFKELVDKCQFDLELTPMQGKWTLTDIDKDGYAEITLAWRAGCRSDVSPITHKVIMFTTVGGKVVKYALRGNTRVSGVGGDYKVDPAFKKAPKGFLGHAKNVWKVTANEKM